jgi:hypothetical protein
MPLLNNYFKGFLLGLIFALLILGFSFLFAWTPPSSNPPSGNVDSPLNIGNSSQIKLGKLGIATDGIDSSYGLTVGNSGNQLGIKTSGNSYFERNIYGGNLIQAPIIKGTSQLCIGNDCRTSWPSGGTGDITAVYAGSGLGGGGTSGSVTLWANTGLGVTVSNDKIQLKHSSFSCSSGYALRSIDLDTGQVQCEYDDSGTGGITSCSACDSRFINEWQSSAALGNLKLYYKRSCSKLYTDSYGNIKCGTDQTGISSCSACDSRFVNVTGDTMRGNLYVPGIIDRNDTRYYLNPDAVSVLYYLTLAKDAKIYGKLGVGSAGPPQYTLDVNGSIRGSRLVDRNNINYYVDPAGGSKLWALRVGRGGIVAPRMFDSDNTFYRVDPSSTTILRALEVLCGGILASCMFDSNNVFYRVDPSSTTRLRNLEVTGSKSAVVNTSQGMRRMYAVEAPTVNFVTSGSGELKNGKAEIKIEPLFLETINTSTGYQVLISPTDECSLYISEKRKDSFVVKKFSGKDNCTFDWFLFGVRKNYEDKYMEQTGK